MNYQTTHMLKTVQDIMSQKESIILNQLNDLISRGLLVVEEGTSVLTYSEHSSKIELNQSINLKLKDQDYIEQLERENKELKARLNIINDKFTKAELVKNLVDSGLLDAHDLKKAMEVE